MTAKAKGAATVRASVRRSTAALTRRQITVARSVVAWYLSHHYGKPSDSGTLDMFCDPRRVGHFAVTRAALSAAEPETLFRLLVTTAMFQRRQDLQILRILRSLDATTASELTTQAKLLQLVDRSPCLLMKSLGDLHATCNLAKDPIKKTGCCSKNPSVRCHLKQHTVLLRRYGHFGKVPTSIALMVREAGAQDMNALRATVLHNQAGELNRAKALEKELSRAWRVSQKIASMFLSTVSNPDLSPGASPWSDGIDWTYYVVVDSNVDLFLKSIDYTGSGTYDARREFIRALARRVELDEMDPRLHRYNPRILQQAMYLFMSAANRRAAPHDCGFLGPQACRACPKTLSTRCPRRVDDESTPHRVG